MNYTPRQLQILKLIHKYQQEHGFSPTYAELADELDVSTITVFEHLEALERKGAIRRRRHEARSVEIVEQQFLQENAPKALPLMGHIAAGKPIEALEMREELPVGDFFSCRKGSYILKVKGESMIDDHIMDGDYVVVEGREAANDGEVVVAMLDDGAVTLKRYYRDNGKIRLQPANSTMQPILLDRVTIQGVVKGVVRYC